MRNKYHIYIVLLLAIGMTTLSYASGDHDHSPEENSAGTQTNTYCPVMGDMKVDTQIFTDYKGKRVYFCCLKCKSTFQADPTKYLHRLPQFGSANRSEGHEHKNRGRHFSAGRLIKSLGITTLS
jgi:YHS domain-containing protein